MRPGRPRASHGGSTKVRGGGHAPALEWLRHRSCKVACALVSDAALANFRMRRRGVCIRSACACVVCVRIRLKSIPTINDSECVDQSTTTIVSCAIAFRSPAPERSSDLKRYSPDIHDQLQRQSSVRRSAYGFTLFAVPHKGLQVCTGELPDLVPGYMSRPAALKTGLEAILTLLCLRRCRGRYTIRLRVCSEAEDEVAGAIFDAGLDTISRCFALDAVDEKQNSPAKHGGASRGCGRGGGWGGGSPAAPACACTLRSHP